MQYLIHGSDREGVVWLRLRGEFDLATVAPLNAAIDDALTAPRGLVVDLHGVTFLDCATVGVLMRGRNLALDRGLSYRTVGAHGIPRWVMELTGVLAVLDGQQAGQGG
jgi:anti-sigma B factor antagonist